ncbi:hypothetical protein O9H85_06420 [Paenibacillus filicis]|uniref:Uncharacterized protein n=1 Tax=Paenibacillus gyeongsangnamensis TaxID=3388067 RepID=A0ABT4Q5C2_9BACL|nr:hypothetical protein [Paenibacillus filicis]MCZ8512066.1 hypothetical protein [Paenibacillus filicis]
MSWTESLGRLASQLTTHKPSLYPTEELDDLVDIRIGKLPVGGFTGEQLPYAHAVKAGLHLFNESLDASHELSQMIENATGSYWHGIMHRMEGDYSNAKYWFHRVSRHPVYEELAREAAAFVEESTHANVGNSVLRRTFEKIADGGAWDAFAFVDAVEQQVTVARDETAEQLLLHIQWLEMRLLLKYAYARSGGGGLLVEPR